MKCWSNCHYSALPYTSHPNISSSLADVIFRDKLKLCIFSQLLLLSLILLHPEAMEILIESKDFPLG